MMPEKQVRLRAHREDDLPNYVKWLNDPEVTEFTAMEAGTITLAGERAWLRTLSDPESRTRSWAIEAGGRHVGNCALELHESGKTAGFGIVIGDKTQWGKGYGTAALRQVLHIGFHGMGLLRIHLHAFTHNVRGLRCYEKCGFLREGLLRRHHLKRGQWVDIVCMGILQEEWKARCPSASSQCDDLHIRSYRPTDYPALFELWQTVGFEPTINDSPEKLAQTLQNNLGLFIVAEKDDKLIGSALGVWDGRRAFIWRVAIHPDWQGNGFGRRLVSLLENRLQRCGASRVALLVLQNNERAIRFYRSLGYELVDRVKYMSKNFTPQEQCNEPPCPCS